MKQPVEKTRKSIWFDENPEKRIVIKFSDIKRNYIRKRKRFGLGPIPKK